MEKYKNILVLGLGISGISSIKLLNKLDKNIYLYDKKDRSQLIDNLSVIDGMLVDEFLGGDLPELEEIDLVIKSPGMNPKEEIIDLIKKNNIELITDIELAYRLSNTENIIAITGTNGKTTVVTLLNEVLNNASKNVILGGNIGFGILDKILDTKEEDIMLIEASSFQLNDVDLFKPKISAITNLGSDHLDWHITTEEYRNAKKNVYLKQDENDFIVLDYDNTTLRTLENVNSQVVWCSIEHKLEKGIFIEKDSIIVNLHNKKEILMNISDIKIFGQHNLKNILYVVGIAAIMGINLEVVANTIKNFKGVEHRLEFVESIEGVKYINDSKGTNMDSTIVAIDAFTDPIVLIAGGKDEGASFEELVEKISKEVKSVILFGETKGYLYEKLYEKNYKDVIKVSDMREAVTEARKIADIGDVILFSPACASYDMYNNYEERGKDFKGEVRILMREA